MYLSKKTRVYLTNVVVHIVFMPAASIKCLITLTHYGPGAVCHCTSYMRMQDPLSCLDLSWPRKTHVECASMIQRV